MNSQFLAKAIAIALLSFFVSNAARGQEEKKAPPAEQRKEEGAKPQESLSPLEKKFVETLTGATLAGRWRLVDQGKLGEEKEEKYTIASVSKWGAETWVIGARIQYGNKDVTIPVPVKVLWAGDTPVISITNAGLPGLGTYTARVMIYEGLYSGTWFGPGHGGFLSGKIEKSEGKPEKTKAAQGEVKEAPAKTGKTGS